MILNHFRRCLRKYSAHFYLILSLLEDINNTFGFDPLSVDDLLAHYYVKPNGVSYVLYKHPNKKHVHFYVYFEAYEVGECYTIGNLRLTCLELDYYGTD